MESINLPSEIGRATLKPCYLGTTGFSAASRYFFREFSKHVDLRIRNYTWDSKPGYLNEEDFSIIDTITLSTGNGEDRYFTNNLFESGLSYLLIDTINMSIELDNQIYGMCVETASLDGIMYSTSQEFANAIFG